MEAIGACPGAYISGTDGAEYYRKLASWNIVASAIRVLVNTKFVQLECTRVLRAYLCQF